MIPSFVYEHVRRLMTRPGQELGRWARFARFQIQLWQFCAKRLHENNLLAMSAALSFRTIFAMIPALVLAFLAAGALGVLEDSKSSLRRLLDASGFSQIAVLQDTDAPAGTTQPTTGVREVINVADQIESVVTGVQSKLTFNRIGPIGAVLFVWTALTLLMTVEACLNRIFEAAQNRSIMRRVLLYWSAVTLGPVVVAVAVFLGRRAIQIGTDTPILSVLVTAAAWLGPTLVGILVLAAAYILLPNTKVRPRAALGGAAVAVLAWLVAKWAFALYIQNFVIKGNLYGILGVFPLFLMWLNLSWTIFLFGAELAHTAANLRRMEAAQAAEKTRFLSPTDALAATLAVARPWQAGQGPVAVTHVATQLNLPGEAVQWLLDRLVAREILCPVDAQSHDHYMPARPPEQLTLDAILNISESSAVPAAKTASRMNGQAPEIAALVAHLEDRMRAPLAQLTVADVLAGEIQPARPAKASLKKS